MRTNKIEMIEEKNKNVERRNTRTHKNHFWFKLEKKKKKMFLGG